jgi:hypothetical protein
VGVGTGSVGTGRLGVGGGVGGIDALGVGNGPDGLGEGVADPAGVGVADGRVVDPEPEVLSPAASRSTSGNSGARRAGLSAR